MATLPAAHNAAPTWARRSRAARTIARRPRPPNVRSLVLAQFTTGRGSVVLAIPRSEATPDGRRSARLRPTGYGGSALFEDWKGWPPWRWQAHPRRRQRSVLSTKAEPREADWRRTPPARRSGAPTVRQARSGTTSPAMGMRSSSRPASPARALPVWSRRRQSSRKTDARSLTPAGSGH